MRTLPLLILSATLFLGACSLATPEKPDTPVTGIRGIVRGASGQPVAGASIFAYRNARSGLRGPADFAAISNQDGDYLLDLVPGSYHLVARLRSGGGDSGPPRPGDAWALPANNPVTLAQGELFELDFTLQQVLDQRNIAGTLTTAPFSFTGSLMDSTRKPLDGAMALAYRQPDLHRRPDFSSRPSSRDGSFTLYLPDPGPWCLVFRQHTRGQLRAGELHANYGDSGSACSLTAGKERDLGSIVLTPFGD